MELVERAPALQVLEDRLRGVASGTGHTVLLGGEAGIGKTSVLKTLAQRRGAAALWWGACDALQTPHPLAPLQDIARSSEVRFGARLGADAGRAALFEAVLTELQQALRPTLVVIEDVHWADDATLDLLTFLGRRIDRAGCLLVVSYRDDELTPTHPLRRLLGGLPSSLVTRLELPRLSPAAVEELARGALQSPAGIHATTHGNPFFVTELLRHRADGVPRSVQDLVLARFARLGPAAQAVVRLASVVPARIERWLVDELLGTNVAAIEECLDSGLLTTAPSALCFRHELARVAIESSLSEPVAQALNADVLKARAVADGRPVSLARLVHRATRAVDSAAVLRYAPEAPRQAQQRAALDTAGICFMFAQAHHGAMRHVSPIRQQLGFRTIFNLLGPLSNPAGAKRQVVGVPSPRFVEPIAQALGQLGATKAWSVHGSGLDELTTTGETDVAEWRDGFVRLFKITPEAVGLPRAALADITGGAPAHNATELAALLDGKKSAYRDIVMLNAAAAFLVADKVETLREGVELAAEVIDDGRAKGALDTLIATTKAT